VAGTGPRHAAIAGAVPELVPLSTGRGFSSLGGGAAALLALRSPQARWQPAGQAPLCGARRSQARLRAVLGHLGSTANTGGGRERRGAGGPTGALVAAGLAAIGGAAVGSVAAEGPAPEAQQPEPLSFAQIAKLPRPGMQSIGGVCYLPDGSHVLYLRSAEYGTLSRRLYATNVATGATQEVACTPPGTGEEKELSLEEKLRRERARIMNTGVTSFKVAGPDGSAGRVLVPMGGALFVRDSIDKDAPLTRLFDPEAAPLGPGPILDPQISEDGSLVCFVWKEEVYCVPADGSAAPRALTAGARGTGVTHGLADFLAQEELDRYEGFWISPDASRVAFEEVDETHIPEFRIMHSGSEHVGDGAQEDHRYPFAGKPNPKVKLCVVSVADGAGAAGGVPPAVSFDLTGPFGEDFYLGRVNWLPDGTLAAQVLNREQTELAVLRLDPVSGKMSKLFDERTGTWINIHNMLKPVGKSGKLLWANERTGHRHLYVHDPQSGLRQLTKGEWQVEDISAVDEKSGVAYFVGTSKGKWLERHLFRVRLDGRSDPQQVTTVPGTHSIVIDPQCRTFVDITSAVDSPAVATLRSLEDGLELHVIFRNEDPLIHKLGLPPPEFVTFPSSDGQVTLQAALYKPDSATFGPGPYPTVISCYGGPHVQFVANTWMMTADLRAQAMRSRGCLVLKVDNRGSNRRGLAFEGAVKHCMGSLEVDDQVAGVRWCAERGLADPQRVGIYGWSYGGYLSAMCLAKASDVFKCAVAGAPVTSWDGYDTAYTERYMGTPESNPDGYKSSSVMEHVANIKGDLLLVHGLIDENVHFRHTARLINALIAAQKPYQLLLFPNERHSPRSQQDREFMEERMWAFIKQSLGV